MPCGAYVRELRHHWSRLFSTKPLSELIMTSSKGNIFLVIGPLCGELIVTGEFPSQGLWSGALMFYLICAWTNGWVNNRNAGDWRRHCDHYGVTVVQSPPIIWTNAGLLSIEHPTFSEIWPHMQIFSFNKMHLKWCLKNGCNFMRALFVDIHFWIFG